MSARTDLLAYVTGLHETLDVSSHPRPVVCCRDSIICLVVSAVRSIAGSFVDAGHDRDVERLRNANS